MARLAPAPFGEYTAEITNPGNLRLADPADPKQNSFAAGTTLRSKPFQINSANNAVNLRLEAPKPLFDSDRLVVKPGEIGLLPTSTDDPDMSTGTGTPAAPAPTFTTGAVTKVTSEGTEEALAPSQSWVHVQDNGTVVATPPSDTPPGEYHVEVVTSDGQRETVTVVVDPAPSMADSYDVKYSTLATRPGRAVELAAPSADATVGGFLYRDRPLPRGTKFEAGHPWATADEQGRITFAPPKDAKPGHYDVPVTITFPDRSTKTVTVAFEVGERMLADAVELGYEDGLSVRPGEAVTIFRTGARELPEGTTFMIDAEADLGGWSASIDKRTGDVRAIAPRSGSAPASIPVTAYFADGSSEKLTARVRVSTSSATANPTDPSYALEQANPGATVTLQRRGNVPAGTEFTLIDGGGLDVAVDPVTGAVRATLPANAEAGRTYKAIVRVKYPDGSTEEIVAAVRVPTQAETAAPGFVGATATVGEMGTVTPTGKVPAGTTFDIDGFTNPDWAATIDPVTGALSVRSKSTVPDGQEVKIPVRMTFPDGSTKVVEVPFRAEVPATVADPVGQRPAEGASSQSSKGSWLAVLLGALAAIAGVGYAVYLNQDKVKELLNNYGIRI